MAQNKLRWSTLRRPGTKNHHSAIVISSIWTPERTHYWPDWTVSVASSPNYPTFRSTIQTSPQISKSRAIRRFPKRRQRLWWKPNIMRRIYLQCKKSRHPFYSLSGWVCLTFRVVIAHSLLKVRVTSRLTPLWQCRQPCLRCKCAALKPLSIIPRLIRRTIRASCLYPS